MIAIFDPQPDFVQFLKDRLPEELGKRRGFSQPEQLLDALAEDEGTKVVIIGEAPDKVSQLRLLKKVIKTDPTLRVIILPKQGKVSESVRLIRAGAFDYLLRNSEGMDRLVVSIERALEDRKVKTELKRIKSEHQKKGSFSGLIGKSKTFQQAIDLAKKVSPTTTSVLLLGETGTGKEMFARAIHNFSPRADQPFVAINCSAIGRELLESEMFGHKKGAFTGARADKKGLFEMADGGTIFLDEIGEMDGDLQAKLLRVLEYGEFYKVGSPKPQQVDVRVIAATNRHLEKAVDEGDFRSDLFFRLSVFQIKLPNLNDRPDDIPDLAKHFLRMFNSKTGRDIKGFSSSYMKALRNHYWKGNIRELKNTIERSVILCEEDRISTETLPFNFEDHDTDGNHRRNSFSLADMEALHIQNVLRHTNGNKSEAARLLDIGLATLYRKIKAYDLEE